VRFQRGEQAVDALCEAIIDDALVLERFDLVAAMVAFLVYLSLFRADKGFLVDVWVYFDIAVVRKLEVVLCLLGCDKHRSHDFDILTHLL
jgi:hypothetical protein